MGPQRATLSTSLLFQIGLPSKIAPWFSARRSSAGGAGPVGGSLGGKDPTGRFADPRVPPTGTRFLLPFDFQHLLGFGAAEALVGMEDPFRHPRYSPVV